MIGVRNLWHQSFSAVRFRHVGLDQLFPPQCFSDCCLNHCGHTNRRSEIVCATVILTKSFSTPHLRLTDGLYIMTSLRRGFSTDLDVFFRKDYSCTRSHRGFDKFPICLIYDTPNCNTINYSRCPDYAVAMTWFPKTPWWVMTRSWPRKLHLADTLQWNNATGTTTQLF